MRVQSLLEQIGRDYFYLMHLSYGTRSSRQTLWEYARKNSLIGLDYGHDPDVNKNWEDFPESKRGELTSTWRHQFEQFSSLENDDCVLVLDGQRNLLGVGLVIDPPAYQFRPELENFFRHVRKVRWLLTYDWEHRLPVRVPGFRNTIVRADSSSMYWPLRELDIRLRRPISSETMERSTRRKERHSKKYGSGGEGTEHRRLKDWVYNHPEKLGFDNVVRRHEEYDFESGDRADVVFDLSGGRFAVIEIETDNPTPGAIQALKYKVLKCVELGLELDSADVEPILVAWRKPEDMKICRRYGIRFHRKRI